MSATDLRRGLQAAEVRIGEALADPAAPLRILAAYARAGVLLPSVVSMIAADVLAAGDDREPVARLAIMFADDALADVEPALLDAVDELGGLLDEESARHVVLLYWLQWLALEPDASYDVALAIWRLSLGLDDLAPLHPIMGVLFDDRERSAVAWRSDTADAGRSVLAAIGVRPLGPDLVRVPFAGMSEEPDGTRRPR